MQKITASELSLVLEEPDLGWVSRATPRKILQKWPNERAIISNSMCNLGVLLAPPKAS